MIHEGRINRHTRLKRTVRFQSRDGEWAVNLRSLVDTSGLKRRRYERLTRLVGLRPTDRILELGCGSRQRSIAAWNRENEIVGVDLIAPSRVGTFQPNFRYRQGDATDLSMFADNSFDVVLSVGMLEHIAPKAACGRRSAKPNASAGVMPSSCPTGTRSSSPIFRCRCSHLARAPEARLHAAPPSTEPVIWPTAREWASLFDDPSLRMLDHWYGPVLLYRILVGGRQQRSRAPADG